MTKEESSWGLKSGKVYPKLTKNIEADAVVVGAGMAGIFTAYILAKAGIEVVVLEKNENILQGATLMTTAFITQPIDTPLAELVKMFGEVKAKLVWESGQDAIDLIADAIKKENIDCGFQFVPAYTYARDEKQFKKLTEEYKIIKKLGFKANLQKNGAKLNFRNSGFLEILNQAKFHPIKFARALAEKAESAGAKFFTSSEVLAIESLTIKTKSGQIKAKDIVIATHAPFTDKGTQFKKGMYVSYVYELEIAKELISEGLYQDMYNPYHYFRIDSYANFDRMIVGGEDNREEIKVSSDKNFNALEKYIKTVLGGNTYEIKRQWYGPILEPIDGLALIGKIKPHTYVATGFSGTGMTYSAISSLIFRDSILADKNAYINLYDPKRIPSSKQLLMKGTDYAGEFFGGVVKNFFSSKK